jgi:hypothetical protein
LGGNLESLVRSKMIAGIKTSTVPGNTIIVLRSPQFIFKLLI